MATIARTYTRKAAADIVRGIPSGVLSGIVPDAAHLDQGGYHVSLDDLRRYGNLGDYSSSRRLDRSPPVTAEGRRNACAIDISMSRADMARTYRNVERVWLTRARDTRAKYLNAINVWSGRTGDSPVRFNFQTGTRSAANRSHEWHGHGDWVRIYVDDAYSPTAAARAARAMVSVWLGQSHDDWLRQEKLGPYAPKPDPIPTNPPVIPADPEDDDMIIENHQLPDAYGYDPKGAALPDAAGFVSVGLPPIGLNGHPAGAYGLYLYLTTDHITAGTRVRVAIHDGKSWHVKIHDVPAGAGRRSLGTPPPAQNGGAYCITIGRVQPTVPADAPTDYQAPGPTGSIALTAIMLRKS